MLNLESGSAEKTPEIDSWQFRFPRIKKLAEVYMSLQPDFLLPAVEAVTPAFLQQHNIRLLILDADSTLILAQTDFILPKRVALVEEIRKAGIRVMVASNGKTHRIEKAFGEHKIEAHGYSLKPLPFRLKKLVQGYAKNEVLLVGDQFFTDVLCAKLLGIRCVMVEPFGPDKGFGMKLRRFLEKKIIKRK